MISLPKDWMLILESPRWHWGPYGSYNRQKKLIKIIPLPIFPQWMINETIKHETYHAWGLPGCRKPWCLMWEAEQWKKKWKDRAWEHFLGAPFQLLNGFRLCKKCMGIFEIEEMKMRYINEETEK